MATTVLSHAADFTKNRGYENRWKPNMASYLGNNVGATVGKDLFGLIVDDDDIQCAVISEALKQRHIQSISACSQKQLEGIDYRYCRVIVLDLNMPELSGIDVLNIFAQKKLDIPIIILSAADSCMINIAATYGKKLGLHITDSIKKPFVSATFHESLHRAIPSLQSMNDEQADNLIELMPQIVWAAQPDGSVIYLNPHWVEYTGRSLEESYGYGWSAAFHPSERKDSWKTVTEHNGRYTLESRLRRADNVYRWWKIQATPVRDAAGNILKWFGTCTDIEELKQGKRTIKTNLGALCEAFDTPPALVPDIA